MTRAALLLPGRGSYTEGTLGCLPPSDPLVQRAESLRTEFGLESLIELDAAERFSGARHLKPSNVSALIYVKSMLDARAAAEQHDLVCVGGNSMGWYTALAAAGALDFEDGFRLVQRMALLQEEGAAGGQVIYPVVDASWAADPAALAAVEELVERCPGEIFPSITLGGYRVVAGSPSGVKRLLDDLPAVTIGKVTYPFRLALHGPYHTPLANSVAQAAVSALGGLEFRAPRVTLIDGFGRRHSPWSADPHELRRYTFGAQVTAPFDFSRTVRVALREYAPERLVLTGPGNTLGGVVGQVLCTEGWGGVRTREDFLTRQEGDRPLVESMGR